MSEFVSIVEAQSLFTNDGKKNSSIYAVVIKIGDLKSGTNSKGDWTKKDITLKDDSGTQVLTAWNDDIKKFELNITYKIESPYWTIYNGAPQLSLGQYCTVTIAAEPSIAPTSDEYLKTKQTGVKQNVQYSNDKIQKIISSHTTSEVMKITGEIENLLFLEHLIKSMFEGMGIEPKPEKIGMYMKILRGVD